MKKIENKRRKETNKKKLKRNLDRPACNKPSKLVLSFFG
jgi:hypothetical protein